MYNSHPSSPPSPPSPPSLPPSLPPSPPLPSPQQIHCPFQPKQSPSCILMSSPTGTAQWEEVFPLEALKVVHDLYTRLLLRHLISRDISFVFFIRCSYSSSTSLIILVILRCTPSMLLMFCCRYGLHVCTDYACFYHSQLRWISMKTF